MPTINKVISFITIAFVVVFKVNAEDSYSPNINRAFPEHVFWGDTHLHTNLSPDGSGYGNSLSPDDAYRFAKGETVAAPNGMKARLQRPLDFLVIADHAVNMGVLARAHMADPKLRKTQEGKFWYDLVQNHPQLKSWETYLSADASNVQLRSAMRRLFHPNALTGITSIEPPQFVRDITFLRSVWQEDVAEKADSHNVPGSFTAFAGYEWTPSQIVGKGDGYGNFHRVVIFKDGAEKTKQILPFSRLDSQDPEELWKFLENYERDTGGEVIAIPHNGNATRGAMFALTDLKGQPLSKNYALARSRWEPLLEVTQVKGDGEAHPALSPTDEFADFETWNGWYLDDVSGSGLSEVQKARKRYEYARSALKLGLGQQAKLGVNPFKFGMIGSTDAHTSLAAVREANFWGATGLYYPRAERIFASYGFSSAGYAAVWAEENTRDAIFAAMKRKEVYASTGSRITVRFFGGWDYEDDDAFRPDFARIGYENGVPMGGDLTAAPSGKAPKFLIRAVKDPDGANLDRVQIVKGWRGYDGVLHEKVYDAALSDGRKKSLRGKVRPVGNTVDVEDASYTNTIGDPELAVVWKDPDFNEKELAFYYLRVLEIPTPRWTAYDAKYFGLTDLPREISMITQERAYSSPIWYSPEDTP